MTKKPVRRYTVDGKGMTPDDLQRLHDYLRPATHPDVFRPPAWRCTGGLAFEGTFCFARGLLVATAGHSSPYWRGRGRPWFSNAGVFPRSQAMEVGLPSAH
jgi:hypothetical protein